MKQKDSYTASKLSVVSDLVDMFALNLEMTLGPAHLTRELFERNAFILGYLAAYGKVNHLESAEELLNADVVQNWANGIHDIITEVEALTIMDAEVCNVIKNILYDIMEPEPRWQVREKSKPETKTTDQEKKAKILQFPNMREQRNKERTR